MDYITFDPNDTYIYNYITLDNNIFGEHIYK